MKLIVVACNAATSAALPALQASLAVPVVGVIAPEAAAAVRATRNRRIGLLATQATVTAGRYEALVRTLDAGVRFTAVACPELVPLIEAGEQTVDAVREYAAPLKAAGCDTVILGCTHYPLIRPVSPARVRPRRHARLLGRGDRARGRRDARRKGWENAAGREGAYRFLTTGDPDALPGARRALPAAAARRGRPASRSPSSSARGMSARRRAAARPAAAGRRRPARSSSSRTGWCSGRRARRASSAPRASSRTSRAGSTAAAAAG